MGHKEIKGRVLVALFTQAVSQNFIMVQIGLPVLFTASGFCYLLSGKWQWAWNLLEVLLGKEYLTKKKSGGTIINPNQPDSSLNMHRNEQTNEQTSGQIGGLPSQRAFGHSLSAGDTLLCISIVFLH